MGAEQFIQEGNGSTPKEAFENAVATAQYNYGHAGYTGSCAEKRSYKMIPNTEVEDWIANNPDVKNKYVSFAEYLLDKDDHRIDDKWGPAGCIQTNEPNKYLFFGWASS